MLSALQSIGYRIQRSPLRLLLVLATVAIGVAVLGLTLTVSFEIGALLRSVLPAQGRVISITNGSLQADGSLKREGPPDLTASDITALRNEYLALRDLTPIAPQMGGALQAGSTLWMARGFQGVGASFASLMDLRMVAGSFFSPADEEARASVMVVSESVARTVFGSPEAAIGQKMSSLTKMVLIRKRPGDAAPVQQGVVTQNAFAVVGVYRDLNDVKRRAFGVGDVLVPYTAMNPGGADLPPIIMSVMARVIGDSVPVARARVTDIVRRSRGSDYAVAVWEGNPDNPDPAVSDARDSLSRFSLFLSGLGVLVLVVSCFGIFSVMLVEIVDRNREIGLRRALGSSRGGTVGFLAGQAALLALFGSVIGTVLTVLFHPTMLAALAPYLQTAGVAADSLRSGIAAVPAVAIAAGAAVAAGALFALPAALRAARRPIVECLRED